MTTATVSTEEQEQILQTIEMFEVIVQSNATDTQSLEILKEAYWKLGRQKEALGVTRRLADAYMQLGQYSSSLLEYEGILQKDPQNAQVLALLGEVEAKLNQPVEPKPTPKTAGGTAIDVDFGSIAAEDPTLMTINQTRKEQGEKAPLALDSDGNEPLAKFLIQHKLAPEEAVNTALDRVRKLNNHQTGQGPAAALIEEVTRTNTVDGDALLSGILDRTKFAYIPLESYDVDRQIVKMLPESLTLGRLIVPFDLMSRTVMVAMANPFDALGKEAVQQLFDYNIQWHLASPAAIGKVLRETYKLAVATNS